MDRSWVGPPLGTRPLVPVAKPNTALLWNLDPAAARTFSRAII